MALKPLNNVGYPITTTGTGAISIPGTPLDTYQTISDADATFVDSDSFGYRLEENDEWEIGYLTLSSSLSSGARTVLSSSNSGSPINLSGAARLFSVVLAQDYTNLISMAEATIKGRLAGSGSGVPINLTLDQLRELLAFSLDNVVALSDGATPALDAGLGNVFTLAAEGNRTIAIPTNPRVGKKIIIAHTASGGARTLSLNTGTGGFRFGSEIIALTETSSGVTDYIGCIYNATANKWDVVAYVKGYS